MARIVVIGLALFVALGVTWRWSIAQQTTTPTTTTPTTTPTPTTPTPAPTPPPPPAAASPTAKPSDPKAAEPSPAAAAVGPPLDLKSLEKQLKDTKAIGVFTKIALKNRVDDLLEQFSEFHRGKATRTLKDLRRTYDLLLMKVLSLLQDEDQPLARAIVSSREAIWDLLADPKRFATLRG